MTTKNFLILFSLVSLSIIGYYIYTNTFLQNSFADISPESDLNLNSEQNTTTPQPSYVLPDGEQIYNVSHGEEVAGPKMSQIVYSPLAFESGQTQKVKIIFPENEVVGSVILFISTDNKEKQKVVLKKESKINTWAGEWIPSDTIKSRYSVKITATGLAGEYINTMNFL